MYILDENNNRGYCSSAKGLWWEKFMEYSRHNMGVLKNGSGKFLTHNDFKENIQK